ncbi:lytic transglycosylase domain-containing protein [Polaromonas aquatica]|uniref:Lytic transglycosylase domain-containing protein n=1 Tax=Polaromonas aquatica TaxID=332657 RepID=A0ABW1TVF7_9BURK
MLKIRISKLLATSVVGFLFIASTQTSFAQSTSGDEVVVQGPKQPDDCVTQAATYHSVSPWVLRAIIQVESSFNPNAMNKNNNGTVDVGIAQINSMHFKELGKFGIAPRDLMNGCIASYVAAWHLKKQVNAYGNTWFAVGAYHSATPCFNRRYTGLVWNVLLKWGVVNGPKAKPVAMSACAPDKSSTRVTKSTQTKESSLLALD